MSDEILIPKALSIQQPWAWLITHGYKDIENRKWKQSKRGPILIHASQKFDIDGYRRVCRDFPEIPLPLPFDYERGGIVGRARIVDCLTENDAQARENRWFDGPFGYVLRGAEPLPFHPCAGSLYFFEVPAEVREALKLAAAQ